MFYDQGFMREGEKDNKKKNKITVGEEKNGANILCEVSKNEREKM